MRARISGNSLGFSGVKGDGVVIVDDESTSSFVITLLLVTVAAGVMNEGGAELCEISGVLQVDEVLSSPWKL